MRYPEQTRRLLALAVAVPALALGAACDWIAFEFQYEVLLIPFPAPGAVFEVVTFTDLGPLTIPAGIVTFEGTLTPAGGRGSLPAGKLRFDFAVDGETVLSATVKVQGNGDLKSMRVKLKQPIDVEEGQPATITVLETVGDPIRGNETLSLSASYEAE